MAEKKIVNMLQKLSKYDLTYYPLLQATLLLMGTKKSPSIVDLNGKMY